jgi:hypothetical protein
MEALQLLKFTLKKERLNFMEGWQTSEEAMSGMPEPAHDLHSLFVGNPDTAMDNVLNAISNYELDSVI